MISREPQWSRYSLLTGFIRIYRTRKPSSLFDCLNDQSYTLGWFAPDDYSSSVVLGLDLYSSSSTLIMLVEDVFSYFALRKVA